jgi:hypothetical protein
VIVTGLLIVGMSSGAEGVLDLGIGAAAPLVCLWAPYAVAHFPLAGLMFTGRPASHRSSEDSVVFIGWILLVVWVGWVLFEVFG